MGQIFMKDNFSIIFNDNIIKISTFSSGALILFQTILIFLLFPKLPPLIPFLNSKPWGIERLYPKPMMFVLILLLIVVFIVNNLLTTMFYKKNTLLARILSFNSFIFTFLALLAFLQIFFLVF